MRTKDKAFTDDEIRAIRADWESGTYTQRELATKNDTSQAMISRIVNYRSYKHVS